MLDQVSLSRNRDILDQLLAITVHVFRPVSITELRSIIKEDTDNETMQELIQECGSFLTIREDMVEFIHLSAQDYIMEHHALSRDADSVHHGIYLCSMHHLSRVLKRDIYEVDSCIHVDKIVAPDPDPLGSSYALIYWTRHLELSGHLETELVAGSLLDDFFRKHYLHWLEAVALKKLMHQAVYDLHILYSMTKKDDIDFHDQQKSLNPLVNFIHDAHRFILYFRDMLDENPLQVYDAGLTFCPANSLVRAAYKSAAPAWAQLIRHPEPDWPSYVTKWSAKVGHTKAVAYNLTGNLMAVAGPMVGSRAFIQIFNMDTGSLSNITEKDGLVFSGRVGEMVFSPDSSKLFFSVGAHPNSYLCRHCEDQTNTFQSSWPSETSESNDLSDRPKTYTFGVWDIYTNRVTRIADLSQPCRISANALYIAYKDQRTVKLANIEACTIGSIKPQSGTIRFFTLSTDSCALAILTNAGYIEIWTTNLSLETVVKLEENYCNPFTIVLSYQSNILIAFHNRCTVGLGTQHNAFLRGLNIKSGQWTWIYHAEDMISRSSIHLWQTHDGWPLVSYAEIHQGIIQDAHTGAIVTKQRLHLSSEGTFFKARLARFSLNSITVHYLSGINQDFNGEVLGLSSDQLCLKMPLETSIHQYRGEILHGNAIWKLDCQSESFMTQIKYPGCLIADGKDNVLTIYRLKANQHETHASIEVTNLNMSSIIILGDRFVVHCTSMAFWIWDFEQQTMATTNVDWDEEPRVLHSTKLIVIELYARRFLTWSPDNGFEKLDFGDYNEYESKARGHSAVSPSGTYLAFPISGTWYDSFKLRIWNVSTKAVMTDVECLGSSLSAVVFSPCETKFIVSGPGKTRLWSISGTMLQEYDNELLCRNYYYSKNFLSTFEEPIFTSETTIASGRGVLGISAEGFSLGTKDEPFILNDWIYLNNQKVLKIPKSYLPELRLSGHRLKGLTFYCENRFAWQHNDITVLQIKHKEHPNHGTQELNVSISQSTHRTRGVT
ncbi:MAG: hypothetical protein GOMPHAMPRED_002765 [Gomphillus americanus]|uniref:Uncharacterized protein n=1 Tax=Gomphillus americanus TaxID=1940652 RepID=A0A8H3ICN7_9LECA|nr:MAG: hypothetical protein GOMPHAMPRED_002765 [Gomphillus americanus]